MLKRPHYIALGLVLVMTLTLLNLPGPTKTRLKLGIGSFFLPLFGLAGASHQLVEKAGNAIVPRGELVKQNEELRRQNQELRLQALHGEELEREIVRLKQLLGRQQQLEQQKRWKLKLANVVVREPANWWRTVQIDVGTRNGVSNNLPVLTADGFLVGRISSVGLTSSQVVLLGDPNCKVPVLVENETRVEGIVGPYGPLDTTLVSLSYLPPNANVKPGQNVVTSGKAVFFPPGVPVGKIVDFRTSEYGLSTEARVKIGANLNSLEELWVLLER